MGFRQIVSNPCLYVCIRIFIIAVYICLSLLFTLMTCCCLGRVDKYLREVIKSLRSQFKVKDMGEL